MHIIMQPSSSQSLARVALLTMPVVSTQCLPAQANSPSHLPQHNYHTPPAALQLHCCSTHIPPLHFALILPLPLHIHCISCTAIALSASDLPCLAIICSSKVVVYFLPASLPHFINTTSCVHYLYLYTSLANNFPTHTSLVKGQLLSMGSFTGKAGSL